MATIGAPGTLLPTDKLSWRATFVLYLPVLVCGNAGEAARWTAGLVAGTQALLTPTSLSAPATLAVHTCVAAAVLALVAVFAAAVVRKLFTIAANDYAVNTKAWFTSPSPAWEAELARHGGLPRVVATRCALAVAPAALDHARANEMLSITIIMAVVWSCRLNPSIDRRGYEACGRILRQLRAATRVDWAVRCRRCSIRPRGPRDRDVIRPITAPVPAPAESPAGGAESDGGALAQCAMALACDGDDVPLDSLWQHAACGGELVCRACFTEHFDAEVGEYGTRRGIRCPGHCATFMTEAEVMAAAPVADHSRVLAAMRGVADGLLAAMQRMQETMDAEAAAHARAIAALQQHGGAVVNEAFLEEARDEVLRLLELRCPHAGCGYQHHGLLREGACDAAKCERCEGRFCMTCFQAFTGVTAGDDCHRHVREAHGSYWVPEATRKASHKAILLARLRPYFDALSHKQRAAVARYVAATRPALDAHGVLPFTGGNAITEGELLRLSVVRRCLLAMLRRLQRLTD